MIVLIFAIGCGFIVAERFWPANALPKVRAWYARVILLNAIQMGIVIVAGFTWNRWLSGASLFAFRDHMGTVLQAVVTYAISSFVFYWWHRWRHTSNVWWNVCHQLHHSARRIEVVTAFYKHPVEITLNSILTAILIYALLGITVEAAALYTVITAVAEFFYHWNIRTPVWLGPFFQRPESHRIHHKFNYHTQNYADLPIFDIMFGTYENPQAPVPACGFTRRREDRFEDILVFRDLHDATVMASSPLHLLPTCIGCRKRWACHDARV